MSVIESVWESVFSKALSDKGVCDRSCFQFQAVMKSIFNKVRP